MSIPEEKIVIIEKWKEVASQMVGKHFNFRGAEKGISEMKTHDNKFIREPSEENFREFWDKIWSAKMSANSTNMINKRFEKKDIPFSDVAGIIKEMKNASEYDDRWEKRIGFITSHPSTMGELFGLLHIDSSPIYNSAVNKGLEFFNYPGRSKSYSDFKKTFNEFKKEYLEVVGSGVTQGTDWEIALNLEIDQLFNSIDKIKKAKNIEDAKNEKEKEFYQYILDMKKNEHLEVVKSTDQSVNNSLVSIPDYSNFTEYLIENGHIFDKNIIENLLLSLKVKPFVILTGNSGTGKTKLAQLFARYCEMDRGKKYNVKHTLNRDITKTSKLDVHGAWTIGGNMAKEILPDELQDLTLRIDNNIAKGSVKDFRLYYERDTSLSDLIQDLEVDTKVKIEILDKMTASKRYEIIPVGSNWNESRHVVGYYNVIQKKYESTVALDLIRKAEKNTNTSHFLILDEMNLSHVERYFSDFLSAMESREPIPLYIKKENGKTKKVKQDIPPNLLVLGTVNVDETTYMFSPKVLDRANVIEFNVPNVSDYMQGVEKDENDWGDINYLENPLSEKDVKAPHRKFSEWTIEIFRENFKDIKTKGDKLFWDAYVKEMQMFQNALEKAGFEFGFRVINEITAFMYVAWKYERKPNHWENWARYFDAQIKQKLLPKIHGSQRMLGDLFHKLINLCFVEKMDPPHRIERDELAKARYPNAARKIWEMDRILRSQRYVSFTK